MSTGKSKTIRRTQPARTAREADARWGLGFAGAAQRGSLDAYTAEHYAADTAAGVIAALPRECPRHRPERECPGGESLWSRRAKLGRWTAEGERPAWVLMFEMRPVCFDCRMYIYWSDRQANFQSLGFDHGLGYVRPTFAIRRLWGDWAAREPKLFIATADENDRVFGDGRIATYLEALRAAEQLYLRERAALTVLAGAPLDDELPLDHPERMQRYEQAVLLETVRHCITCNLAARLGLPQPTPRVRLMSSFPDAA